MTWVTVERTDRSAHVLPYGEDGHNETAFGECSCGARRFAFCAECGGSCEGCWKCRDGWSPGFVSAGYEAVLVVHERFA